MSAAKKIATTSPMLEETIYRMNCFVFAYIARPSLTASTCAGGGQCHIRQEATCAKHRFGLLLQESHRSVADGKSTQQQYTCHKGTAGQGH